jgi:hypothetical protein
LWRPHHWYSLVVEEVYLDFAVQIPFECFDSFLEGLQRKISFDADLHSMAIFNEKEYSSLKQHFVQVAEFVHD